MFYSPEKDLFLKLCNKYSQNFELLLETVWKHSFQTYIVEQWVSDRSKIVSSIVTFTGDKKHEVKMCCLRVKTYPVPEECKEWHRYVQLMEQNKCKVMETNDAKVFVSSLSSFPTEFNIIHVPDGDLEKHLRTFNLNMNLKRLGCSGRSALTIQPASTSQKDRFVQIYKTLPSVELHVAVFDMIKLVQAALYIISCIPKLYTDGLLCDSTVVALRKFNQDYGPFESSVMESECDPVLMTALLSKVVTIRNKISALGFQCPKNPFAEISLFGQAIQAFLKANKISSQSSLLDIEIIEKVEEIYARSSPPALKVPRVLKRLDDGSGKDNVDLETTDLDLFIRSVHVDALKALWGGKKKGKGATGDVLMDTANLAEELLQGGKEFGKNLLKNVSGRAQRMPEPNLVIKGLRTGVAEGFSRISSSVEGFVDRRRPRRSSHKSKNRNDVNDGKVIKFPQDDNQGDIFEKAQHHLGAERKLKTHSLPIITLADKDNQKVLAEVQRSYSFPSHFVEVEEFASNEDLNEVLLNLKKQEVDMVNLVESLKHLSNDYAVKIHALSDIYLNNWHGFADVETILNDVIDQQRLVQNRIDSLELRSSKLQYEISVLEDKIRETDETIDNFNNKMRHLDRQVAQGIKFATQFDVWSYFTKQNSKRESEKAQ